MILFGYFTPSLTDGNQFIDLGTNSGFITLNFAWGNLLLSDTCLGVYGAVPEINFTSAMAQLPEQRIYPTL